VLKKIEWASSTIKGKRTKKDAKIIWGSILPPKNNPNIKYTAAETLKIVITLSSSVNKKVSNAAIQPIVK